MHAFPFPYCRILGGGREGDSERDGSEGIEDDEVKLLVLHSRTAERAGASPPITTSVLELSR